METEQKLTAETFPASPEKQRLKGKINLPAFGSFRRGDGFVCFTFATYLALRNSTMSGPKPEELFDIKLVLQQP